jgi:Zn-dependent M28 family amino/carboxypeptidase
VPATLLVLLFALLQSPSLPAPASAALKDDVATLAAATTNEERFEAIAGMLKARQLPFSVETFTIDKARPREPRTEGRNIVVSLGTGGEEIVVGAHYDAARISDGTLSRAAVDNAASSVILVRLAETLRTEKLAARVKVVWFDMEELGLIGSERYAKQHAADGISAMLNFDINAYGDTILYGPSGRAENARLRRTFVETCAAEDVPCIGLPQMPPGDDRSFVAAGVPAISSAILPGVEAHQLWLMMNAGKSSGLAQGSVPPIFTTIHTAQDTPDKVDEAAMNRILRFGLALVRRVAGTSSSPRPGP